MAIFGVYASHLIAMPFTFYGPVTPYASLSCVQFICVIVLLLRPFLCGEVSVGFYCVWPPWHLHDENVISLLKS